MKKLIVLLMLIFTIGCEEYQSLGSIKILVSWPKEDDETKRSTSIPMETAEIIITLSKNKNIISTESVENDPGATSEIVFEDLEVGKYTISGKALDHNGNELTKGDKIVEVAEGDNSVSFELNPVNHEPGSFELLFPLDNMVFTDKNINIRWDNAEDEDDDVLMYNFLVGNTENSISKEAEINNGTTTYNFADSNVDYNEIYWKIQAEDPEGAISDSSKRRFYIEETYPISINNYVKNALVSITSSAINGNYTKYETGYIENYTLKSNEDKDDNSYTDILSYNFSGLSDGPINIYFKLMESDEDIYKIYQLETNVDGTPPEIGTVSDVRFNPENTTYASIDLSVNDSGSGVDKYIINSKEFEYTGNVEYDISELTTNSSINITFFDGVGNQNNTDVNLIYDNVDPVFDVVTSISGLEVTVNIETDDTDIEKYEYSWSYEEGWNAILGDDLSFERIFTEDTTTNVAIRLTDEAGNYTKKDNISVVVDTSGFYVSETSPENGATDLPANNQQVKITFSDELNESTILENIELYMNREQVEITENAYSYNSTESALDFGKLNELFSGILDSSEFQIIIKANIKNSEGDLLGEDYTLTFETTKSNNTSYPVIDDKGFLYLTSRSGKIYIFNTSSNEEIESFVDNISGKIYGSPVLFNEKMYFGTLNGYIYNISYDSGNSEFSLNSIGNVYPDLEFYSDFSSNTNAIYLLGLSSEKTADSIITVSEENPDGIRNNLTEKPLILTKGIYANDEFVYFFENRKIYRYDISSKEILDSEELKESTSDTHSLGIPERDSNDNIYISANSGEIIKVSSTDMSFTLINTEADSNLNRKITIDSNDNLYCGDSNGNIYKITSDEVSDTIKVPQGESISSAITLYEDNLYFATTDGYIYSYSTADLTKIWSYNAASIGTFSTRPAVIDTKAYFMTNKEKLICVDFTTESSIQVETLDY